MADEAPMTPDELREIIARLGWSQSELAEYAKRDYSRIRKIARGANPIDADLAQWLRKVDSLDWLERQNLIEQGVPLKRS